MSNSFNNAVFSEELEKAGITGAIAAGLYTALLIDRQPGAVNSTPDGFIWTKTVKFSDPITIPIGSGDCFSIEIQPGIMSGTLAVDHSKGELPEINFLFSLFGEDTAPELALVFNKEFVVGADAVTNDEGHVVGFKKANQTLKIPLPAVSVNFNFQFVEGEDGTASIASSVEWNAGPYDIVNNPVQTGLINIDIDKVLVFPNMCHVGLYIKDLFLDLSEDASTNLTQSFPTIYNSDWKGLGAKNFQLFFPLSPIEDLKKDVTLENTSFITGGVENMLIDFEGKVSLKATLNYNNHDNDFFLDYCEGSFELYENTPVQSNFEIALNIDAIKNSFKSQQEQLLDGIADQFKGIINSLCDDFLEEDCQIQLVLAGKILHFEHEKKGYYGFEFLIKSLKDKTTGNDFASLELDCTTYKILVNSLLLLGGGTMVGFGYAQEDPALFMGGVAVCSIMACALIDYESNYLHLDKLALSSLGIRYAQVIDRSGDEEVVKEYCNMIGSASISIDLRDSKLLALLEGMLTGVGTLIQNVGELFNLGLDTFTLAGNAKVSIENIDIPFKDEMPDDLKKLFGHKKMKIKLKEIPEIQVETDEGEDRSFCIEGNIDFLQQEHNDETHYGISLGLEGINLGSSSLSYPIKGLAIFFYPELRIDFIEELAIPSTFEFLIPNCIAARGDIKIDKPLPSANGKLSLVELDAGIMWKGKELKKEDFDEYFDMSKYNFKAGVTFANGVSTYELGDVSKPYSFQFVSAYLKSSSTLFALGPVGFYGFGALFGRNVRPNYMEGGPPEMAKWLSKSSDGDFIRALDWSGDGNGKGWKPSIDEKNGELSSIYQIGALIDMGSPYDNKKTYSAEVLLMLGLPQWDFAFGGIFEIPCIGLKGKVIIVITSEGFTVDLNLQLKIDSQKGKIVKLDLPVNFGAYDGKCWNYIGHYDSSSGIGPAKIDLFDGTCTPKFYYTYSSKAQEQVGMNPFKEDHEKPTIPGPSQAMGILFELGPKTYGPSFLNVKLYAALGLDVAFHIKSREDSETEYTLFGELFAGGYIKIKVFFFKFNFELVAILSCLLNERGYRYAGEIKVRIPLPWPFDDIKCSFDWVCESDNFLPLQSVDMITAVQAAYRLENKEVKQQGHQLENLPIDGVVSIKFDRPIIDFDQDKNIVDTTIAFVNDDMLDDNEEGTNNSHYLLTEESITEFEGITYKIVYEHVLEGLCVSYKEGNNTIKMDSIKASWDTLALWDHDGHIPESETHKAIYLNTLIPTDLQYNGNKMGEYSDWYFENRTGYPCEKPVKFCLEDAVPLSKDSDSNIPAETKWGQFNLQGRINDSNESLFKIVNQHQLTLTNHHTLPIQLPYHTEIDIPLSKYIYTNLTLDIRLADLWISLENYKTHTTPIAGALKLTDEQLNNVFRAGISHFTLFFNLESENGNKSYFEVKLGFHNDDDDNESLPNKLRIIEGEENILSTEKIELDSIEKINDSLLKFRVVMVSKYKNHRYKKLKISGWKANINTIYSLGSYDEAKRIIEHMLQHVTLNMDSLCMIRDREEGYWGEPMVVSGSTEAGIEVEEPARLSQFNQSFLFEPNKTYSIDYAIRSTAHIYHLNEGKEDKLVATKEVITATYDTEYNGEGDELKKIPSPTFKTQAIADQNLDKYIGLYHPDNGEVPVYPDYTAPVLTLKSVGLIQDIYKKHHNNQDVLFAELTDIDGHALYPEKTFGLDSASSPTDEVLNDLLQHCIKDAARANENLLNIWDIRLKTNKEYAVKLSYKGGNAAYAKVPFSRSFKTSQYKGLREHVQHVNELLNTQDLITLSSSDSMAKVKQLVKRVTTGQTRGHDQLIETIYFKALGEPEARMTEGDGAYWLAGVNDGQLWGCLIELNESMTNKNGIAFKNTTPQSLPEQGIYFFNDGHLILHDKNGGRMFVFQFDTNTEKFEALDDDFMVNISFDGAQLWEEAVSTYINETHIQLEATKKNQKRTEVIKNLRSIPSIDQKFKTWNYKINFNTPNQ